MNSTTMEIWPGRPLPLGAHYDGAGTNFSVFSGVAERIELCLYERDGAETRVVLPEVTAHCWHGYLPGVGPGQRYGFRVYGPFEPFSGNRCNPHKLLLDPYARAIEGRVNWNPAVFDYHPGRLDEPSLIDSAPYVPRSVVVNPFFDWREDRLPRTPWHETVIYELHPKGFTKLLEKVPEEVRGTYAGLAHPASVDYLLDLGITAIELQPIHHFVHDERLVESGLRNYWGYNSIGYFAPPQRILARGDCGTPGSRISQHGQDHAPGGD